jgi:glycine/D-amino acid oxidase-like deaminating enzyme
MSYAQISHWLATAGDLTPRPTLDGDHDVDVVVVGAGYTGLWTAWYLAQRDPLLRIAICESEIAGYGASGRNGAWCSAGIGMTTEGLIRRYGAATAGDVVLAMRDTVNEIGRVCVAAGIAAEYRKGGMLRIARGPQETAAMQAGIDSYGALGLDSDLQVLSADELAERVNVASARGALFDPHCATVHPGHLVRGLAAAVEQRGVTLYERTPVTQISGGGNGNKSADRFVCTPGGRLRAGAIVIATEAWTSNLPGYQRALLPIYSLVVLTDPLSPQQWAAIGWEGHECLSSHRLTVDYLSRTLDGRILFGGRGAPYHFGSRVAPRFDRHTATHQELRAMVSEWFPALRDARIAAEWGGPLGMPRDWLPNFRYDAATGIAAAWGFTGQGVAASNLAGRTLADLMTHRPSPLTVLPMVGHRSRRWEPEPLRWIGARYIQRAFARIDDRAQHTGRAPSGRSLAERLMRH